MEASFFDTINGKIVLWLYLICSISVHEWGHAFAADLLGDPLPRAQKRVTLNPLAHVDPIGTALIPFIMIFFSPGIALIGWGKPVQISLPNPKTRMRDDIICTAAGPLMNVVIAVTAMVIGGFVLKINTAPVELFVVLIQMNVALVIFNLIPLPPLDGSRIVRHIIGMPEETFMMLTRYSMILMLVLVNIPMYRTFMGHTIAAVTEPLFRGMTWIYQL